ncbi:MAG: histidine--tRNA ligase [Candidatus Paceibacterota bacterium]
MSEKNTKTPKLSTEPYKGVRDFYPADQFTQNYIFGVMKKTLESFGYEEYGASVLEPAELYRAKSGEEIVNDQTYTFTDRGEREVTLRPEMTPSVARLIAAKRKEMAFPVRWYSIPNLFRYEQPQRGRLREHWQLNADVFGIKNIQAEVETLTLASTLLRNFGLKDNQFEIRINSRKIMNYILRDLFMLNEGESYQISKLIDKKEKISKDEFAGEIKKMIGERSDDFLTLLNTENFAEFIKVIGSAEKVAPAVAEIKTLIEKLEQLGITNVVFTQTLMRGFDYYTGIVFEVFDTNPKNRRSIFGGGRYDDLLAIFGEEKIPAFGFGMGDVVIRDVLETYGLLPKFEPKTQIYICSTNLEAADYTNEIAQKMREVGISAAVDYTERKIGDQIKYADKNKIPFVTVIGEDEVKSGKFKIKRLSDGKETEIGDSEVESLVKIIKK